MRAARAKSDSSDLSDSKREEIWLSEASFLSDPLGLAELRTLPRQLPQLLVVIVFLGGGVYANCVVQAFLQQTMGNFYKKDIVLYDFLFEVLPVLSGYSHLCDGIVYGLNYAMLARFAIFCGPRALRVTIVRRWATCFGLLYYLRALTMVCTVLPNPDDTCVPRLMYPDNIWLQGIRLAQQKDVTCQDVLYSGHTVNITLAICVWVTYSRHSPLFFSRRGDTLYLVEKRIVPLLSIAVCLLCLLFVVATRFHYSVDVFLGALVSLLIFWGYHQGMCVAKFRKHRPFQRFIGWLEDGAPDHHIWMQTSTSKAD